MDLNVVSLTDSPRYGKCTNFMINIYVKFDLFDVLFLRIKYSQHWLIYHTHYSRSSFIDVYKWFKAKHIFWILNSVAITEWDL